MTTLRIEKIIDPNTNPVEAAEQTSQPWCSVTDGPWIVIGTDNCDEAAAFVAGFRKSMDLFQWSNA